MNSAPSSSSAASSPPGHRPTFICLRSWKEYGGPRHVRFDSSADLPLRGQMHLYFLTPDEFEHPSRENYPGATWSSADLLARVRPAYGILLEEPHGYARDLMERWEYAPDIRLQVASQ